MTALHKLLDEQEKQQKLFDTLKEALADHIRYAGSETAGWAKSYPYPVLGLVDVGHKLVALCELVRVAKEKSALRRACRLIGCISAAQEEARWEYSREINDNDIEYAPTARARQRNLYDCCKLALDLLNDTVHELGKDKDVNN